MMKKMAAPCAMPMMMPVFQNDRARSGLFELYSCAKR